MHLNRTRRSVAALLGVGALLASLAALAVPASAATRTYRDPAGDTRALDLTKITTTYAARLTITAEHGAWPTYRNATHRFTYFIDTNGKNAGPEYFALIYPNSDGLFLKRTDDWGGGTTTVTCPRLRAYADMFNDQGPLMLSLPGRCIGNPPWVRVAVRSQVTSAAGSFADWVAGRQAFIPGWVVRY